MDKHKTIRIQAKRVVAMAVALLLMLVGSGFIFGWASLLRVLQVEGVYSELCPDGKGPCEAQTLKLNAIFTFSTFALLASALPAGILLDRLGPRILTAAASIVVAAGSILMAFSNSKTAPMYIPGYTLMGIGGNSVGLGLFTISSLATKYQSAVVGAFTAVWNASPLVLLIFSLLYTAGVSYQELFLGFLIVPAALLGFVLLWPKKAPVPQAQDQNQIQVSGSPAPTNESPASTTTTEKPQTEDAADAGAIIKPDETKPEADFPTEVPVLEELQLNDLETLPVTKQKKSLKEASLFTQLLSPEFILAALYLAGQALFVNTFIGTLELQAQATWPAYVDSLVGAFGVVFPVGQLVCAIIVVPALAKCGVGVCYIATSVCAMLLALSSFAEYTTWWAFIFNFAMFSLWRSFLYCTSWAYAIETFGYQSYGTISGIMNTLSGIVSFIQYGLVALMLRNQPTGLWLFFGIQAVVLAVLFVIPVVLLLLGRRGRSNCCEGVKKV